jgi:hypothetical protein
VVGYVRMVETNGWKLRAAEAGRKEEFGRF